MAHVVRGDGLFVLPTGYPPNDPLMVNVFGHGIVGEIQQFAIPTYFSVAVVAGYGSKTYARDSLVFGEKEAVVVSSALKNSLYVPVQNAPVKLFLDGKIVATVNTDWLGVSNYVFNGIPAGAHIVQLMWEGDFWNAPSSYSVSLTTVTMEPALYTFYVASIATSIGELESLVMDDLLTRQIGARVYKAEADADRFVYKFNILVSSEPTIGLGTIGLIAPIVAVIIIIGLAVMAIIAAKELLYTYSVNYRGEYYCSIDDIWFPSCESYKDHMIAQHPAEWTKIQNGFTCELPAPDGDGLTDTIKMVAYAGVAVAGIMFISEIMKTRRKD